MIWPVGSCQLRVINALRPTDDCQLPTDHVDWRFIVPPAHRPKQANSGIIGGWTRTADNAGSVRIFEQEQTEIAEVMPDVLNLIVIERKQTGKNDTGFVLR